MIDYQVQQGPPTIVRVTSDDGQKYELRVQVVVFGVDTIEAKTKEGYPGFAVRAALSVDTLPVAGPSL